MQTRPHSSQINAGSRTLESKLDDFVSVKDFMAQGDGVTNDTAALVSAFADGRPLWFPAGDYFIVDSIPNFHERPTKGPGRVIRGAEAWYASPSEESHVNRIYYSPIGSNSNDGLTSDKPRKTLGQMFEDIRRHNFRGDLLGGRWEIRMATGTWSNENLRLSFDINSAYGLSFIGEVDVGGNPASVIQQTNATNSNCMWFDGGRFTVQNVKFHGYNRQTGYGFLQQGWGITTLTNCTSQSCDAGFQAIGKCELRTRLCDAQDCTYGYRAQYSSTGSFGSPGNGCTALQCDYGVYLTRNAVGHVDFLDCQDAAIAGVLLDMAARAHVLGSDFKRCAVGVRCQGASEWINNTTDVNTFNMGTVDACTVAYHHFDVSRETRLYGQQSQAFRRVGHGNGPWSVTGSTSATTLVAAASPLGGRVLIPPHFFSDTLKSMKLTVWGEKTGSGGSKNLHISASDYDTSANTANMETVNLGSSPGHFRVETEITALGPDSQAVRTMMNNEAGTVVDSNGTASAPFNTVNRQILIRGQLGNSGDSIIVRGYSVELCG